jgi:hypothetical protein
MTAADSVHPGRSGPRSGRVGFGRVLALVWGVLGSAGTAYLFILSTAPVIYPDEYFIAPSWIPRWLGSLIEAAGILGLLPWLLLPLLLLIIGLSNMGHLPWQIRWRWATAWTGAVAAGLLLEILIPTASNAPDPGYSGPAILSPGMLAESGGFLLTGLAMAAILARMAKARPEDRRLPTQG